MSIEHSLRPTFSLFLISDSHNWRVRVLGYLNIVMVTPEDIRSDSPRDQIT